MKNFANVFRFTIANLMKSKSYIMLTAIMAFVIIAVPSVLFPLSVKLSDDNSAYEEEWDGAESGESYDGSDISVFESETVSAERVFCASDEGCMIAADAVCEFANGRYGDVEFIPCADYKTAESEAGANDILLRVSEDDSAFLYEAYVTENSALDEIEAEKLAMMLSGDSSQILASVLGLSDEEMAKANVPVSLNINITETEEGADADADDGYEAQADDIGNTVFGYLVPYLNIMLVYFLVLFYAQGTATSVITEKTSKLMDTFLVSVKPEHLIIGKIVAICTSAIVQFLIWIASLAGGCLLGCILTRSIYPNREFSVAHVMDMLGDAAKGISVLPLVVGILIIIAGFFLYSSLSAFGGALASKPEDLGITNQLFTISLLISFFAVMYGGLFNEMEQGIVIFDIIPFTSMMITPARMILGYVPAYAGLISLAISVALSLGIGFVSGRVFRYTAFRRGDPPKPGEIVRIVKNAFGKNA